MVASPAISVPFSASSPWFVIHDWEFLLCGGKARDAWKGEVEFEDVTEQIAHLLDFVHRSKINQ